MVAGQYNDQEQQFRQKISRIRELRGMEQETLAEELVISQQAVSNSENSEKVDDSKRWEVAKALGVTKEAIENFSEESMINYFNTFNVKVSNSNFSHSNTCTFNPIDKVVELYEHLVHAEKDKVAYLEKLLDK